MKNYILFLITICLITGCGVKPDNELTRKERIDKLFNDWDGSQDAVVDYIKKNIKDPDSYKHIETKFRDDDTVVTVITKFTATNGFGARVQSTCKAVIDTAGNLIDAKLEE